MFKGGHNYATAYARHLAPFLDKERPVIVEVGVLEGSGLALWSRLWPQATIIGLDIDPVPFQRRIRRLKLLGAFALQDPIVLRWDQLAPDRKVVARALGGRAIDILVDDGLHTTESILRTAEALEPLLAPHCVYFVEDHCGTREAIEHLLPSFDSESKGELTVFSRG